MVSKFPVSLSKEKYRNALTSKGSKFGRDWLGTYYQMRLASPARGKAPKRDTCATVQETENKPREISGLFFFLCADLQTSVAYRLQSISNPNKINDLGAEFIDVRRFGFEMLFARTCRNPALISMCAKNAYTTSSVRG